MVAVYHERGNGRKEEGAAPAESDHSDDISDGHAFTCEFECKNFQLIPKSNHLGEHPASLDFWMDVKRRKTWDFDTNNLLENCSIEELRESGAAAAVRRLPVGVKSIRTTFFFRDEVTVQNAGSIGMDDPLEGVKQNQPSSSCALNRLTNTAGFAAFPNNMVRNLSFPAQQHVTDAKKEYQPARALNLLAKKAKKGHQSSRVLKQLNSTTGFIASTLMEPAARTDFAIGPNFASRLQNAGSIGVDDLLEGVKQNQPSSLCALNLLANPLGSLSVPTI